MQEQKAKSQAVSLPVTNELKVTVIPNNNHEFLMPTKEVAAGYGVSSSTIRDHRKNYYEEFTEQKHFIKGVEISDTLPKGSQPHQIFWTKRGIVRLGFFIKSKQAKLFRDWAEDLVINQVEQKMSEVQRVKHEYGATYELIESAAIACGSQGKLALRLGISKAVFSHVARRPWLVSEDMLKAIIKGCKNIIAQENRIDIEAIEALVMVSDEKARITLYNKLKKGGLL